MLIKCCYQYHNKRFTFSQISEISRCSTFNMKNIKLINTSSTESFFLAIGSEGSLLDNITAEKCNSKKLIELRKIGTANCIGTISNIVSSMNTVQDVLIKIEDSYYDISAIDISNTLSTQGASSDFHILRSGITITRGYFSQMRKQTYYGYINIAGNSIVRIQESQFFDGTGKTSNFINSIDSNDITINNCKFTNSKEGFTDIASAFDSTYKISNSFLRTPFNTLYG